MKKRWARKIPLVIAAVALGAVAFSGAVMLLWNGILPVVLHVSAITLWQAMGILLLCKILFGGFRGRRGMGCGGRRKDMLLRWQNMTPEEKEQIRSLRHC